jgi:hypothetical protein
MERMIRRRAYLSRGETMNEAKLQPGELPLRRDCQTTSSLARILARELATAWQARTRNGRY